MAFQISGTTIINNSSQVVNLGDLINAVGNTGGAATINLNSGNFVTATLTGNCTWTFSNPNAGASSFTLLLYNDGAAGRSITWPAAVRWPNNTIPVRTTTASRADVYTFFSVNSGATWYGNVAAYNYT